MVFNWGHSAALLECKFLVLRVGDIHFLIDDDDFGPGKGVCRHTKHEIQPVS